VRIGFTFDLRDDYLRQGYTAEEAAELDAPETIDAVETVLTSLGHVVERIGGIRSLTTRLAGGARWDLVFNYAEGLFGFGREAQVPALLDAFQIPYTFSDALVFALTLHKALTKHVVRDLGIPTPDFAVVSEESDLDHVRVPYPLFVKPVAAGSSMGISAASLVAAAPALRTTCLALLERFHQPALVEAFLPGRELTVGLVGTGTRARVLGVMEVLSTSEAEHHAYSFANKQRYVGRVHFRIADDSAAAEAADMALRVWTALGCRDGGRVDCRCDGGGRPHFLEVNPLPGLHPIHSDLVILAGLVAVPYAGLVASIVASACERLVPDGDPTFRSGVRG
jgi:D-alanine-D-alanine ligase